MAGLLRHAAEITAVTNQTVNSYKRLVPGFEAPVHISWARNNRSGLIRVPIAKRGNPSATRIEYRSPDPACNPYLAFACMLAAGMRGIAEGYELPPEADANLFEMTTPTLAKLGIDTAAAVAQRLAEGDGAVRRWCTRRSASTSSSGSCATSAASGARTRPTSAQFEFDRYLRAL